MNQRIVVTISIDIPTGATVTVGGSDALDDAPWPGNAAPAHSAPQAGPGACPAHGVPFTWKEGGVSKAGKAYDGFWKCGEKNADGSYCDKRPPK